MLFSGDGMNEKRARLFSLLETKKAEVIRRLEGLSAKAYATGDWSPAQVGYHLMHSEAALRAAPDGARARRKPIFFVGCALLRAAVPLASRAREEPERDMALPDLTRRWAANRETLQADLEAARPGERFCQHPVFGALDADAYLEFADAHLTYHLKRWPTS